MPGGSLFFLFILSTPFKRGVFFSEELELEEGFEGRCGVLLQGDNSSMFGSFDFYSLVNTHNTIVLLSRIVE